MPNIEINISTGKIDRIPKAVSGFYVYHQEELTSGQFMRRALADAIDAYADRWRDYRKSQAIQNISELSTTQLNDILTGLGLPIIEE